MEYIMIFLEGIITFISPCILPMIPIYVSYFMKQDSAKEEKTNTKAIINSLGFIIGFTIIFTILGVISASLGILVRQYIKYLNILLGAIIIILGINFMEVIKLPFLNSSRGLKIKKKNFNFLSSLLFGIIFGITWSPCVGTFLATSLSIITPYSGKHAKVHRNPASSS